jgi:hypothetical protein
MISSNSLVLVCLLPNPHDLEIARLLGWYRIPLRTAPKLISVDYLAFYQPASFGVSGNRIEYIAEVRGNELTTRAELLRDESDHPHARDEYYKIQLGALERLENPIHAKTWKRLTFLYTIGEYLLQARSINDLVVKSGERKLLWRTMRERSNNDTNYPPEVGEFEVDDAILALILGYGKGSGTPE